MCYRYRSLFEDNDNYYSSTVSLELMRGSTEKSYHIHFFKRIFCCKIHHEAYHPLKDNVLVFFSSFY